MNVFGIGLPEMALIMVIALLIFGPKKLPEIGRSLAKGLRSFQDASKEFESEFKREAEQLEKAMQEPQEATLEEAPRLSHAREHARESNETQTPTEAEPSGANPSRETTN